MSIYKGGSPSDDLCTRKEWCGRQVGTEPQKMKASVKYTIVMQNMPVFNESKE